MGDLSTGDPSLSSPDSLNGATEQPLQASRAADAQEAGAQKQWGGRFARSSHPLLDQFSASIPFDRRLAWQDIRGSIAHARMLGQQGIITAAETTTLIDALEEIQKDVAAGTLSFDLALEDVHTSVEVALRARIGDLAGKLHTARSRNDQVALDIRLFMREAVIQTMAGLLDLIDALVQQAEATAEMVMPGYTHLQPAQPITAGHHLMAYVEMLSRDFGRLHDCYMRTDVLPLGAGALAGVPYPIDRHAVATELHFRDVSRNSLDAVSDRDFLIDYAAAASIMMMHLSRLGEEIVLWTSEAVAFWELDDALSTGSSIMPQKKNPDVAELVRGKSGRVFGHLMSLLTLMKGLPLAYNKDMQEDKEAIFDTVDTVLACLAILPPLILSMRPRPGRMRAAAGNLLCATDVADYLAMKGLPFRQAHEITGRIVRRAIESGISLQELPLPEYQALSALFEQDLYECITPEASVAARRSFGGTAPEQVYAQIAFARSQVAAHRAVVEQLQQRQTSPPPPVATGPRLSASQRGGT